MVDKVMLIRHGEKPTDDGAVLGVDESGRTSADELSVRGWQRAGALVRLFAPARGQAPRAGLATPDALFAPATAGAVRSKRSQHTIQALAEELAVAVNTDFRKGQEIELAARVLACNGVILVCWPHQGLPAIAKSLTEGQLTIPDPWPESRFDVVWTIDYADGLGNFAQLPQLLLPGDREEAE